MSAAAPAGRAACAFGVAPGGISDALRALRPPRISCTRGRGRRRGVLGRPVSVRRGVAGGELEWLRAHLCELCIQAAASEAGVGGQGFVIMQEGVGRWWRARWSAQLCRGAGRGKPVRGDGASAGFFVALQVGRGADGRRRLSQTSAWLPMCLVPHDFMLWPHAAHAW